MKAYPYQHKDPTTGLTTISEGMTLRDYIAIHAMQAIRISKPNTDYDKVAEHAYFLADEMLKAREA
jgi:hypothetical protein